MCSACMHAGSEAAAAEQAAAVRGLGLQTYEKERFHLPTDMALPDVGPDAGPGEGDGDVLRASAAAAAASSKAGRRNAAKRKREEEQAAGNCPLVDKGHQRTFASERFCSREVVSLSSFGS
jgi:hypothetical protein